MLIYDGNGAGVGRVCETELTGGRGGGGGIGGGGGGGGIPDVRERERERGATWVTSLGANNRQGL